jgi:hypothetical protein
MFRVPCKGSHLKAIYLLGNLMPLPISESFTGLPLVKVALVFAYPNEPQCQVGGSVGSLLVDVTLPKIRGLTKCPRQFGSHTVKLGFGRLVINIPS